MSGKADVKDTKEMLTFVARVANLAEGAAKHGFNGALPDLVGPVLAAPAAFAGMTDIPTELADLQDDEAAECKALLALELDLDADAVEMLAEELLGLAFDLAVAFGKVRAAKEAKAAAAVASPA